MAMSAALDIGIKGSGQQTNVNKNLIVVHGVRHFVETPRDPSTGMPKGKPNHGALEITKSVDLASPGIRQAMLSGKLIGKATLDFWRMPPAGGKEENHYSIILTGARIVSVRHMSLNNTIESQSLIPDLELVRFNYQEIDWKYKGTERDGNGNSHKVNTEGEEKNVNPAPDELDAWAKGMLLGAEKEMEGHIRNTLKLEFAALLAELKNPQQPAPAP